MGRYDQFELRRQSDGLVYRFDRKWRDDWGHAYKRSDADLWIVHSDELGWVAIFEDSDEIAGRPWSVLPQDQSDHPPEGDWVSKKGPKSHVYSLVYVTPAVGGG